MAENKDIGTVGTGTADTATPATTTEQRESKKQISTGGINFVKRIVNCVKPRMLVGAQRYRTYQAMMQCSAVATAIKDRINAIELAQYNGRLKYNNNSEESKKLRDFLQYNMDSLKGQTVGTLGASFGEMLINGWAPHEMVFEKDTNEYQGMFKLKKLAYIHPLTLDTTTPYDTDINGDGITKLRQSSNAFMGVDGYWGFNTIKSFNGYKEIDANRLAIATHSATSAQPDGISLLDHVYSDYQELVLLQDIMMVGVQRDLSGLPIGYINEDILATASSDPASKEAQMVMDFVNNLNNLHSGDNASITLPSSLVEGSTSLRDWEVKFVGVDGGGKSFDIVGILDQKRKSIFAGLSSTQLISGENGSSSYNLREGQAGTAALHAAKDNRRICDVWNKVVFPKLLRLNKWDYKKEDLPVWESGSSQPLSADEFGQAVMRTKSLLPCTVAVVQACVDNLGIDYVVDPNLTTEELREILFDFEDNTGESNGMSGTGSTQNDQGGDLNGHNS